MRHGSVRGVGGVSLNVLHHEVVGQLQWKAGFDKIDRNHLSTAPRREEGLISHAVFVKLEQTSSAVFVFARELGEQVRSEVFGADDALSAVFWQDITFHRRPTSRLLFGSVRLRADAECLKLLEEAIVNSRESAGGNQGNLCGLVRIACVPLEASRKAPVPTVLSLERLDVGNGIGIDQDCSGDALAHGQVAEEVLD
jgi:hypothetical protein